MKKNKRICLIICQIILAINVSFANDYYVSKSGNDNNSGSQTAPFLTITKASSVLSAGDNCIIKEGIYTETIKPLRSGSEGLPITYKAFENDSVVISGVDPVSGWTLYKDNIYKASCTFPSSIDVEKQMLFCKNKVMDIARWPNNVDHDAYTVDAAFISSGTESSMTCQDIPNIDWKGGYMWYLGAHSGASWTRAITASSTGMINYTPVSFEKWPFSAHNPNRLEGNDGQGNKQRGQIYLFGVLEALDYPGEWYYDNSTNEVYLMTLDKAKPEDGDVTFSSRENTVDFNNKNYINIDGLNIFGGRIYLNGANCSIKNCRVSNACQRFDDLDNTSAQISDGSILVNGKYNLIQRNIIEYGGCSGIYVQNGDYLTVENNIIRFFDTIGNHSSCIRSGGSDYVKVLNNTIHSNGRDLVTVPGEHCEIAYNDLYDSEKINNDGGCFYVVGDTSGKDKESSVHHNWIHDSYGPWYADGRVAGIYLDNNSKGYDVYRNVIWNLTWAGIMMNWSNWYINIFNNTIINTSDFMGRWENDHTEADGTIVDNTLKDVVVKNNYSNRTLASDAKVSTMWDGLEYSPATTYKNALAMEGTEMEKCFVDTLTFDYHLKEDAPLIDQGLEIPGYTDGFVGDAPDIGALEYGAEAWSAGTDWNEANFRDNENPSAINSPSFSVLDGLKISYPDTFDMNVAFDMSSKEDVVLSVYSLNGSLKKTLNYKAISGENVININNSDLGKGLYILKLAYKGNKKSSMFYVK